MANWFKLYEIDLDETRMRYAMSKHPEVWPVWTGILMECCKHRGDTIKWGDQAHELFGFSDRLKISIPIVNTCITLLCEIEYIQKQDGALKVLKWNEKQDDYLARKSRGYWDKRSEKTNLTVNHSESHIEERRGEEIRREEREGATLAHIPSIEEVVTFGSMAPGIPKDYCEHYHAKKTESNGWIKNSKLILWDKEIVRWWNGDKTKWFGGLSKGSKPHWVQVKDLEESIAVHPSNPDFVGYKKGIPGGWEDFQSKQTQLAKLKGL